MAGHRSRGPPFTTPAARSPHRACKPSGQCLAPTAAHPRPQHMVADPDSPPRGQVAGKGGAPDLRRPSQRQKAAPPGTPFRHPHSAQRRPARAHTVGPVQGPHARTNRTRDTLVAETPAARPEDGRREEGQRLTPDAPHNAGRPSPRGRPPTIPAARSPHRACKPRGECWAPSPTHPRSQQEGSGPGQPAQRAGSRGRGST